MGLGRVFVGPGNMCESKHPRLLRDVCVFPICGDRLELCPAKRGQGDLFLTALWGCHWELRSSFFARNREVCQVLYQEVEISGHCV